ncbi:uncharacterized protein LOC129581898 [Paramacrobiotus metropolitanus]|uniref:uncharacterized protein LOC129581898 n=1 Tax=Paramacrobiotus metropolitanus TaxID=2943436 RepID=UPI00244584C0|nr:uncharacterized protein LOC129581898 [Paramacrobiotus metropolitanus]
MSARLGLRTVASLPRRFGPSLWYLTELNNRSSRCLSYTQSRFATVQEEKRTPDYSKMSLPLKFMIRLIVGYRDYGLTALTFHAVCAGFSLGSIWYLIYKLWINKVFRGPL